jgi:hypothetical protein
VSNVFFAGLPWSSRDGGEAQWNSAASWFLFQDPYHSPHDGLAMMGWLSDDTQTIFHKAGDSFSIVVNFDQSGSRSGGKMRGDTKAEACAITVALRLAGRRVIILGLLLEGDHYVGQFDKAAG